jgi:two-component system, sensor histidine kinase
LTMSVEDTGAGISEKQISRLFETFDRSEDETASNYGDDVRLGLPLAHRYCRLMGGELSVQSKLGSGSRFVVQLPIPALSERKQSAPRLELLTEAA